MSYGEQILERYINLMVDFRYEKNCRPPWLRGLELDFFFPSRRFALEFQGDHHYQATDYSPDLRAVRQRDMEKEKLCRRMGIKLKKIDAVDLEYTRLTRIFKSMAHRQWWRVLKDNVSKNKRELRRLNKEAIEYRHTLIKSFGSVTARRRKSKYRPEGMKLYITAFCVAKIMMLRKAVAAPMSTPAEK